ncbi:meckelin (Transmembrane protein 67) domain-containing protein [Ditylenchus destructor]|nr:meckelin (Transmembrane protein 67) domain-containing protein [Ditylenchus destructor]
MSPSTPIGWESAEQCASHQFFNPVTLKCTACAEGTVPNRAKNDCECAPGTVQSAGSRAGGNAQSSGGFGTMQCNPCPAGQSISQDGNLCVQCLNATNTSSRPSANSCPACAANEIIVLMAPNGQRGSNESMPSGYVEGCVRCPNQTVPDAIRRNCVPCSDSNCFCSMNPSACAVRNDPRASSIRLEIGREFIFAHVTDHLSRAETQCRNGDRRECQHLANMCVLQDHSQDSNQGACAALENIRRASFNAQPAIPVLFYFNTEASIELFRENAIEAVFNVDDTAPNHRLHLVSATYAMNGTFLGMWPLSSTGLFQLCPSEKDTQQGAFRFGRQYKQECRIDVDQVLRDTVFHELYLRYTDVNDQVMLYAIPIINENIRDDSAGYVNRIREFRRDARWVLTRRFFIVDQQQEGAGNSSNWLLRVPQQISLHVQLQTSRDGRIFPPYLRIRHAQFVETREQGAQFTVYYSMDSFRYDKTIEVLMATFCAVSVLWAALKAYSWGRRAGKLIVDTSTIVKFVLYACENISNVFLFVMGIMAVCIVYAYKLQKHLMYLPPTYDQEWSFVAYIISATALKLVVLIHNCVDLALVETFFIDWERPRVSVERSRDPTFNTGTQLDIQPSNPSFDGSTSAITQSKGRKEPPVVIWRTYLIANEWNELQSYRKTSITTQTLTLLLLLEFFSFGDYAKIQPGLDRYNQPAEFSESRMSRFAIDISFYALIALTQWLVQVLIIEKIADPFHNFMDLCSVANISVLAMSHPLRGYYIHGRSVHGLADTNMFEMNTFLQREKENLCGLRGLESASELQTFIVHMPRGFRDRLDQLTMTLRTSMHAVNLRQSGHTDRTTAKIENTAKVYSEINQFLKDVVDHVDPNCDYTISDARLIEEVVGLELTDTTKVGNFVRDPSEMAYSMAFLYGNEWAHMSFEMLLFCLLDLFTHSRILAAAVTYAFSAIARKGAKIFFTNNLIKSSLVDHRFLI